MDIEGSAFLSTLTVSGDNNRIEGYYSDNISITGDSNDIRGNLGSVATPKTATLQAGVNYNYIELRTGNGAATDVTDSSGTGTNTILTGNRTQLT